MSVDDLEAQQIERAYQDAIHSLAKDMGPVEPNVTRQLRQLVEGAEELAYDPKVRAEWAIRCEKTATWVIEQLGIDPARFLLITEQHSKNPEGGAHTVVFASKGSTVEKGVMIAAVDTRGNKTGDLPVIQVLSLKGKPVEEMTLSFDREARLWDLKKGDRLIQSHTLNEADPELTKRLMAELVDKS